MRKAKVVRKTKETKIEVSLNLDGAGRQSISTGIGFLDHMLSLTAKHGLFDLRLKAKGDLEIDIHHTNEDAGITLGEAFNKAIGDKKRIRRFASSFVVLDEAQAKVVIDVNGRPYIDITPKRLRLKAEGYSYNYFKQFLRAFINSFPVTLHIDILKGEDFHHILECCFKALGLALDEALLIDSRKEGLPTTKGKL